MSVRFKRRTQTFWYSEHEYEPIAVPSPKPAVAPVVRITDTDVVPVADSDDSIDDRARLPPELTKDGDVVLPLDGKIEDSVMEGRELVETGDTSEEQETPQQLQERLEERFLNTATPGAESRTDGEVNTSQVDSLALEELPLRRGARGLPQRIKSQAGRLRSRIRSIQRPTFNFPKRQKKPEKTKSTSSGRSERSKSETRPSRMDRIRTSISEKTKFSLPSRPKFSLPDRSKFHLPERPKFNLPERPKFHLPERPKFNIKKPNIRLPNALTRAKKPSSLPDEQQRSTDSTVGARKHFFDFSTYPRIFEKKSKNRQEYATSTPKDSRAQSAESATLPRTRKPTAAKARWTERFDDAAFIDEDHPDPATTAERAHPWRHPALEEPRLSIRMEEEVLAATGMIPWEERRRRQQEEELQYMDYEQESPETSERQAAPTSQEETSRTEEESYERERLQLDPRLYGDQGVERDYPRSRKDKAMKQREQADWEAEEQMMMAEREFRPIQRSRSLGEHVSHVLEDEGYNESFVPVDPRRFVPPKSPSEEEEYEEEMDEGEEEQEPSSAQSDREQQQSSGSSCDRRRRGVIEEIDSDEFFLREGGLSQDDMNLGKYLANEIRDALRSDVNNALADDTMMPEPPRRPERRRSLRKRGEGSMDSDDVVPPARPKRAGSRRSVESGGEEAFRERTRSDSRHRVVYQTSLDTQEYTPEEPLDDIVVVKPLRRKSKSMQRSQSQVSGDPSQPPISRPRSPTISSLPPTAPSRRKRSHGESLERNGDASSICNGHHEWAGTESAPQKPLPLPPTKGILSDDREVLTAEEIMATSQEDIRELVTRLRGEGFVEPAPVPPKRRSRSRGTSVAQDEDRTSHGAESLPEAGYIQEDLPRDDIDSARDLSGYAIVDKREKPPRPPPPRRKRDKFATAPRPGTPKRPQRAYSTLGPAKSREASIISEPIGPALHQRESTPYIEIDSDDTEHRDLRSGEILSKMQGRPLPAPPRPPRLRKEQSLDRTGRSIQEFAMETTTATQTDPLPDDMIIEEEVTQAKLVVAPSRSGSQILVSTERIPSPTCMPMVPPLPVAQRVRQEARSEPALDTVSLKSPSPINERENIEDRHLSAPHLDEPMHTEDMQARAIRAALATEETLRIGSLEVGDLRVDRLSVSQIEAQKIVASEVDALVITASELKNIGSALEENLSPAIIKELMAIRSHLESVAASHAQEARAASARALEAQTKTDIPVTNIESIRAERQAEEATSTPIADQPISADDDESKSKDQKVVKREVVEVRDKEVPVTHTLTVAQIEIKDKEFPVAHTLSVAQVELKDREIPTTHPLTDAQHTQDKSLQIFDSESLLPLSSRSTKEPKVGDSRASLPRSVTPPTETAESRISPECTAESAVDAQKDSIEPTNPSPESIDKETSPERTEKTSRKSRSRSPSPCKGVVRQTASPVRSLPPVISVTPDTPDTVTGYGTSSEVQPQRAIISYSSDVEQSERESQRELSQSPIQSFPAGATHLIAFPASQIPAQFFSMTGQTSQRTDTDPSIADTTRQLLRAIRLAGVDAMRHFVGYLSSMVSGEESREKIREVELTLCALLLLIAGLLIFFFGSTRTVTHHHHWDYFNPPQ